LQDSFSVKEYWTNRAAKGLESVSTVGDVEARTDEEIAFLTREILEIYPSKVDLAIDFGSGWGRLLPVLKETSEQQILVDFVEDMRTLWQIKYPNPNGTHFCVCAIKDFNPEWIKWADYALTFVSLLHIIDEDEFRASVEKIKSSVKKGGHLFIYESYNEWGKLAPHCSGRKREELLEPFRDCKIVKEVDWRSSYQPYETKFHQPIKLFIFRR
jgi:hypothetical protein